MTHNMLCLQSPRVEDREGSLCLLDNITRFPNVPLLQNVLAQGATELLQTQMAVVLGTRASVRAVPPP